MIRLKMFIFDDHIENFDMDHVIENFNIDVDKKNLKIGVNTKLFRWCHMTRCNYFCVTHISAS